MSTDNRFALLEVEDVDVVKTTTTTKNSPKTGGSSTPTPAELKKQKELKQKNNPNPPPPKKTQNTPPPDFDDTGFKKVVDKRQERLNNQNNQPEKKLNKKEFMEKKTNYTGGSTTTSNKPENVRSPQNRNDQGSQGSPSGNYKRTQGDGNSGVKRPQGGNFRSRATKTNKNRGRIEGDVNDKNLNRPDFDPKKKGFGEDKPPRKQGGGGGRYDSGSNYRKKGTGGQNQPSRGRQFDKKSGSGLDPNPKKNEAGSFNLGNPIKENLNAEEDAKKAKEESSESSEYFPEPDEEGEEKKDNVVRKGYNTYLQKLEKDKQQLSALLESKKVPKPIYTEAPKIKEENLPNLNKKERSDVPIDNEKDAFLFKKPNPPPTEEKKEKKDDKEKEKETAPTKKVIPVTEVFKVKTKKHRGINTIDELEKKTGGSPKVPQKEQQEGDQKDNKQGATQDKDTNQKSWDENKQQKGDYEENKQQRRNDNYRGNNRDDRGQRNRPQKGVQFGRGRFNIESTQDFPSLSDNIEVPTNKPIWLPNQTSQQ